MNGGSGINWSKVLEETGSKRPKPGPERSKTVEILLWSLIPAAFFGILIWMGVRGLLFVDIASFLTAMCMVVFFVSIAWLVWWGAKKKFRISPRRGTLVAMGAVLAFAAYGAVAFVEWVSNY